MVSGFLCIRLTTRRRRWHFEEFAGAGQVVATAAAGEQSVVANILDLYRKTPSAQPLRLGSLRLLEESHACFRPGMRPDPFGMARRTKITQPTSDAQTAIVVWLRSLSATGPAGFEGIVRDTLSETTGQLFELSKSGPQGGVDSARIGNRIWVGMEAKRYGDATTLGLDALRSKVLDASESFPDLELWVLATTREITLSDAEQLRSFGEARGLGVLILDTNAGPLGLNKLVAILAACPTTIQEWCGERADLGSAFAEVRQHAAFDLTVKDLRATLTGADVGWEAAARFLAAWTRSAMSSRATARHRLGTFADVLASDVDLVDRPEISRALDDLITSPGVPHGVLGDEGHGKTWGVLTWWSGRAGADGTAMPPIVFLPAQEVQGNNPDALIAEALWKRTGLRSLEFWRRRLGRWKQDGRSQLIIVMDGLNQARSAVAWSDLIRPLVSAPWAERVMVVVTARRPDWIRIQELRNVLPAPREIEVRPFDDGQLDTLLRRIGKTREEFDPRLIPLMKVPRLFSIAVRRGGGDIAITELTPEALAFEEYRHRLSNHGDALPLDEVCFRDLVGRLGKRFHDTQQAGGAADFTLRELREEIGRESGLEDGLEAMVSELAGGRWLEQVGQHRFRLDTRAVPMALGLALVDRLRTETGPIGAVLPDFLDPFRGSDLGVSILRSAAAVAMLQDDVSDALRIALLKEWVDSSNFASGDFQTFWRLACARPGPVLDMAEATWLERQGGHGFDEVLTKALSNAAKQVASAERIILARLEAWMSTWWPDYLEGLILGQAREVEGREKRCTEVLARAKEWSSVVAPRLPIPPVLRRVESGEGWAWVLRRALIIGSYMPYPTLVGAFRGWAAVSAIFGRPPFWDVACWVLRIQSERQDPSSQSFVTLLRELAAVGHPLADRAAHLLADTLASPAAAAIRSELQPSRSEVEPAIDPARLQDVQRHFPEGSELDEDARVAIARYWETDARRGEWLLAADRETAWVFAGVARWASVSLDPLLGTIRDLVPGLDEGGLARFGLHAMYLPIAFGQPDRDALLAAHEARSGTGAMVEGKGPPFPVIPLRLLGASGGAQLDLLSAATGFMPREDLEALLSPFPGEEWQVHLRMALDTGDLAETIRWLQLGDAAGFETPPPGSLLVGLASHADAGVRAAALELLHNLRSPSLAAEFAGSGWTWRDGMPRPEAAFGSLLLLRAKEAIGADVLDRADQQVAGAAFEEDAAELPRLARFVAERVEHLTDRRRSWTTEFEWASNHEALERLVEAMPDETDRWVEALYEGTRWHVPISPLSPLDGLLKGLLQHRPDRGIYHWRNVVRRTRTSDVRSLSLEVLPFDVPLVDGISELREEALTLVHDDEGLAAVANRVTRRLDDNWLVEFIRRDLVSSATGTVARAMTLAGFARVSEPIRELWEQDLSQPPVPGWLSSVHTGSRTMFRVHEASLGLAGRFATAPTAGEARDAYLRLRVSWDRRTMEMFAERVRAGDWPLDSFRRRQWRLDSRMRQEHLDRAGRESRELFCGTRIVRDMSPWL